MILIIVGIFIFIYICIFIIQPTIEGTKQHQEYKYKQKILEEQAEKLLLYGKNTTFSNYNPYRIYMIKPQWKNWFICGYKEGYANKDKYYSQKKIKNGMEIVGGDTNWDRENALFAYNDGYKEGSERKRLENPQYIDKKN